MWGDFCDLALAGGPTHRGTLLEAPCADDVRAQPETYERVVAELGRAVGLVTGLETCTSRTLGWVGVQCHSEAMAVWLLRAIIVENVAVRRQGDVLYLPAGLDYRFDEDGASDPATFAQKAQKLIQQDGVVTVFGGWTSASRKAMQPVFENTGNLLWYPVQFEGNECSPNIMYSGAQPNQQTLPALDWAFEEGYTNFYLVGSDYVFPRTANLILRKHIEDRGGTVSGEDYVPLGDTNFSSVINKVRSA